MLCVTGRRLGELLSLDWSHVEAHVEASQAFHSPGGGLLPVSQVVVSHEVVSLKVTRQ